MGRGILPIRSFSFLASFVVLSSSAIEAAGFSPGSSSSSLSSSSSTTQCAASSSDIHFGSTMSPSIQVQVIPNEKLFVSEPNPRWFGNGDNDSHNPTWTNSNWLKSRFHFSFAEYHSAANTHFGSLRVMNDDLVQPERGFGTHPHQNMEIITYIVHGQLTHQYLD